MIGGKREGAGRKPLFEKTTLVQIRIDTAIAEQIPRPVTAWIREAILQKLKEDKYE